MRKVPPRIGALFGFAAAVVWLVLYLVAALSTPGYSIEGRALSDLGNPNTPTPWAFNAACILTGILFLPYAWALRKGLTPMVGLIGSSLLTVDGVFLILVGAFPEESPDNLHFTFSALFFILLMMTISHYAISMYRSKTYGKVSGILSIAASSIALILVVVEAVQIAANVQYPGNWVANVLEHVSVYSALVWAAWNAGRLYIVSEGTPAA